MRSRDSRRSAPYAVRWAARERSPSRAGSAVPPSWLRFRMARLRAPLREEIRDVHRGVGRGARGDPIAGGERSDVAVAPAIRGLRLRGGLAMDLEAAVDEVHEPVLGDAGPGVQASLYQPDGRRVLAALRGHRDDLAVDQL